MRTLIIAMYTLLICTSTVAAELPPAKAFGQLPMIESLQLSPSGKHLGILRNADGSTYLITQTIGQGSFTPVVQTDNKDLQIRWFKWANDDRLLVSAIGTTYNYGGVNAYASRLTAFDRSGGEGKLLVKPRQGFKDAGDHYSQFQDSVIDILPDDPDHILIQIDAEKATYPGVYKANIHDGGKSLVKKERPPVRNWLTDRQGRVRVGSGFSDTEFQIFITNADKDDWRMAWKFKAFEQPEIFPVGFGADPNFLFVSANHQGRRALFRVDLRDPTLTQKLIVADDHYDISGDLFYSPKSRDAVGVYLSGSNSTQIWFDPVYKALQAAIDKALPETNNRIISVSNDEQRYIVYSSSPTEPGTYYLGDRTLKRIDFLADDYPLLTKVAQSTPKKMLYKTRDGAMIEGFLTLPAAGPTTSLPVVIMPQSGIGSHVGSGFNYVCAFLTSRGYAVLRINTRGASGYGDEFRNAALRTMGTTMPADIADATRWLIEQKIADPQRIAVLGDGFGGYAALMSAATNPTIYRAIVGLDAVTDLGSVINRAINFTSNDIVRELVNTSPGDLTRMSPTSNAARIQAAVLLVHGTNDAIVPHKHSEEMADELKKAGVKHELHLLDNEDVSLHIEANRISFLQTLEQFLAEQMPATSKDEKSQ